MNKETKTCLFKAESMEKDLDYIEMCIVQLEDQNDELHTSKKLMNDLKELKESYESRHQQTLFEGVSSLKKRNKNNYKLIDEFIELYCSNRLKKKLN
jgi:hypothetical protein